MQLSSEERISRVEQAPIEVQTMVAKAYLREDIDDEDVQYLFNTDTIEEMNENMEECAVENKDAAEPEGIGAAGFTMRTSKPSGNKNYIVTGSGGWNTCIKGYPMDAKANALANCVGYTSGRFNEIINIARDTSGCTYKTLNCNAVGFKERAEAAGLQTGSTPRRGAIMCWGKNGGAGHVAIVERVDSNNQVYTSESGYGSTAFWNQTRTNSNGRWGLGSSYYFRCFIYLPSDVQNTIDGSTPAPTPTPGAVGKFNIGDKVTINGPLYANSNASSPSGSVSNKVTNITRRNDGSAHPYNTTGDLGWMDESSITAYSEPTTDTWPKSYTVQSGDTLSGIAQKFYGNGDYNHYMCIANANGISNPDVISAGQTLSIPAYSTPTVVDNSLKVGDTVKIVGTGNGSSNGNGATAYGIGWTRQILKIWSGRKYPYQVGNNSGTTGFYQESALQKQ